MLPTVVSENLITLFAYWDEGIQRGMLFSNELYTQVKSYDLDSRLDAYRDGCELSTADAKVCITVSASGYTLWISLRAVSMLATNQHSKDNSLSALNDCVAANLGNN